MDDSLLIFLGAFGLMLVLWIVVLFKRLIKCPPDKIMVIYGKIETGELYKLVHGGRAFVWPIIQEYDFLDLTPYHVDINSAMYITEDNKRVRMATTIKAAISTDPKYTMNAVERLLGCSRADITHLVEDISIGRSREVLIKMQSEEILQNLNKVITKISTETQIEFNKIGLVVLSLNISDLRLIQ